MDMQIEQFISHLSSFLIRQFMFVSMFHNCIPFSIYKPFYREHDCQYLLIFVLFCLHVQHFDTFRYITLIHWPTTSSNCQICSKFVIIFYEIYWFCYVTSVFTMLFNTLFFLVFIFWNLQMYYSTTLFINTVSILSSFKL